MRVTTAQAAALFTKLQIDPLRSGDLVAGWFVVDGQRVLALHYWEGREYLPGDMSLRMQDQLYVSEDEFSALLDDSMSRDEFVELLVEKGVLVRGT